MTETHLRILRENGATVTAVDELDDHAALEEQRMRALARVPHGDDFDGAQFLSSPELERVAEGLIAKHDMDAQYFAIEVLWAKKMGTSRGYPVWGKTQILTGLTSYYAGKVDIVIMMAANHASDYRVTNYQMEAAIYEELLRIEAIVDDSGNVRAGLRDPDMDGFTKGLQAYGEWKPQYQKMRKAMTQVPLIPDGFLT